MSYASFDSSFSDAFDNVRQHIGDPPVPTFVQNRAPTISDGAPIGAMWIDMSIEPIPLYIMAPGQGQAPPRWIVGGEYRPAVWVRSSARLKAAALLLAVRWYKLPDASLGLVGGQDLGASYVGRIGKDLEEMLIGFRGLGVPFAQDWPTIELLRLRVQVTSGREDPALELALEAAIEAIIEFVNGPPAVG